MAMNASDYFGSLLGALGLAGIMGVLIALPGSAEPSPQPAPPSSPMSRPLPEGLFSDWPANQKPELVLVLTGQQHSYLKFCGCTERQLGGFERRYNFIAKLRERGWPVVSVDLGDLVTLQSGTQVEQSLLKFDTAIRALAALDYAAIALGEHDFKLDLFKALADNVFQNPAKFPPLLCGNMADRSVTFPGPNGSVIESMVIRSGDGMPRVGIVGIAGPSVMAQGAALNLRFETINTPQGPQMSGKPALQAALAKMDQEKVPFRVLLYQGEFESAGAAGPGGHGRQDDDRPRRAARPARWRRRHLSRRQRRLRQALSIRRNE